MAKSRNVSDNKLLALAIVGVGALLAYGGYNVTENILSNNRRGIMNNNPGNIKKGIAWDGLKTPSTDPVFDQFISPEYGIRALYKNLLTYQKSGVNTLRKIISRWSTTDVTPYINYLVKFTGIGPDDVFPTSSHLDLVKGIISFENGGNPYSDELILRGMGMAVS